MIIPEIFLLIAVAVLIVPSGYYWIYPHPKNVKQQKAEIDKLHLKRVAHIENEIEFAIKHQHRGDSRTYGGAEPWAQAERDELSLQDKLNLEISNYKEKIKEIDRFPLTDALVVFSIFLTMIGVYLQIKS